MRTIFLSSSIAALLICAVGCNKLSTGYVTPGNTNSASNVSVKPDGGGTPSLSSGPLLGKWREKETGTQTMEYKPDGTLIITFNGKTFNDRYAYTSSSQIENIDAKGERRYPSFVVQGNELTLTWPDTGDESSRDQHYVRVK